MRRWPRISASSRTPPRATRTKLRPMARATLSPRLVLPTPGGPTRATMAPSPRRGAGLGVVVVGGLRRGGQASLGAQLAHGEELDDALLDVVEALVVGVEHGAGLGQVEPVRRWSCPRAGRGRGRATSGSSPARGSGRWCARGGRAPCRRPRGPSPAAGGRRTWRGSRHRPRRRCRRAPCGWPGAAGAAGTPAAASPRRRPRRRGSGGRPGARPGAPRAQVSTTASRSPTSTASSTSIWCSAAASLQAVTASARAPGSAMRPQDLGQPARAPQLGDVLQHGPQLPDRLLDRRGADALGDRLDVDPQAALLAGDRGAHAATLHAAQDRGPAAHRQVADRLHGGDDADAGVAAVVTGHEQHTLGVHAGGVDGEAGLVGVEREGDDGAGEDHAARHGDERESDPLLG